MKRLASGALLLLLLLAVPAQAAVTITFWSRDLGNYFPHAFFSLRGTLDAGGPAINASYGFTAKAVTPALLFGTVAGRVERPTPRYMDGSYVHFSVVLTDDRYREILELIRSFDPTAGGDGSYNLNRRNCVSFVAEAARRAGLANAAFPKLLKKPRSYLVAVANANIGAITPVRLDGKAYLAALPPLVGTAPIDVPEDDPGAMPKEARKPEPVS